MRRPRDDHPVRLGGRALSISGSLSSAGVALPLAHPARLALAAVLFVLTATALFSQGNLSAGEREDRGNRWVIGAVGLIGLVSAYVPAYTDRTDFWTLDGDILRWIGVVLFAAGGVLRLWPVFVLGRRFSGLVAIQRGHVLVTSGVYGAHGFLEFPAEPKRALEVDFAGHDGVRPWRRDQARHGGAPPLGGSGRLPPGSRPLAERQGDADRGVTRPRARDGARLPEPITGGRESRRGPA